MKNLCGLRLGKDMVALFFVTSLLMVVLHLVTCPMSKSLYKLRGLFYILKPWLINNVCTLSCIYFWTGSSTHFSFWLKPGLDILLIDNRKIPPADCFQPNMRYCEVEQEFLSLSLFFLIFSYFKRNIVDWLETSRMIHEKVERTESCVGAFSCLLKWIVGIWLSLND